MKQAKSRIARENTAYLYERRSRDDNLEGDSYSIQNQKKLLTKIAKEKGYTCLLYTSYFFDRLPKEYECGEYRIPLKKGITASLRQLCPFGRAKPSRELPFFLQALRHQKAYIVSKQE